jgi:hypothetical protein
MRPSSVPNPAKAHELLSDPIRRTEYSTEMTFAQLADQKWLLADDTDIAQFVKLLDRSEDLLLPENGSLAVARSQKLHDALERYRLLGDLMAGNSDDGEPFLQFLDGTIMAHAETVGATSFIHDSHSRLSPVGRQGL